MKLNHGHPDTAAPSRARASSDHLDLGSHNVLSRRGFLTGSAATLGLLVAGCRDDMLTATRPVARGLRFDALTARPVYTEDYSALQYQMNLDQWPSESAPDWAYVGGTPRGIRVVPSYVAPSARAVYGLRNESEARDVAIARLIRANLPTGDQRFSSTVWSGTPGAGTIAYTGIGVRWSMSGTLDGYSAVYRVWENSLTLKRWDGGVQVDLASTTVALTPGAHTMGIEAVGTGATVTLRVTLDGTSYLTFADSTPTRKLAGTAALVAFQSQYAGEYEPYWGNLVYEEITAPAANYARYAPRYLDQLPNGVVYDATLGYCIGRPVDVAYDPPANEILLTDQGSRAANRALLQSTIDNLGVTPARIRLGPVATDWGDGIILRARFSGQGLYIEPSSIKDGAFPRALGQRVQAGDVDGRFAPFRVNWPAQAWDGGEDGNRYFRAAIRCMPGCGNVYLRGLDLRPDAAWMQTLGNTDSEAEQYGQGGLINGVVLYERYPTNVRVVQCSLQSVDNKPWHRLAYFNGTNFAVVDSFLSGGGYRYADSQCILVGEGGSNHLIENNTLLGAWGENIMFGGADTLYNGDGSPIMARVPNNIVIRRNYFAFPDVWYQRGWGIKNLLEFKTGVRVLVERNRFYGYRLDNFGRLGSQRWAYALKSPSGPTRNVCTRLNRWDCCAGFYASEGGVDCELSDNLWNADGVRLTYGRAYNEDYALNPTEPTYPNDVRGQQVADGLTMRRNTTGLTPKADPDYVNAMRESDGLLTNPRTRWSVVDNVFGCNASPNGTGVFAAAYLGGQNFQRGGDGSYTAANEWAGRDTSTAEWRGNVVPGVYDDAKKIAGDVRVNGFADLMLGADYRPLPGSPCTGKGVDIDLLTTALASVDSGLGGTA